VASVRSEVTWHVSHHARARILWRNVKSHRSTEKLWSSVKTHDATRTPLRKRKLRSAIVRPFPQARLNLFLEGLALIPVRVLEELLPVLNLGLQSFDVQVHPPEQFWHHSKSMLHFLLSESLSSHVMMTHRGMMNKQTNKARKSGRKNGLPFFEIVQNTSGETRIKERQGMIAKVGDRKVAKLKKKQIELL